MVYLLGFFRKRVLWFLVFSFLLSSCSPIGFVVFDSNRCVDPFLVRVHGHSLDGLLVDGGLYNFSKNTSLIDRGDVVLVDYKGLEGGVVKVVKGVPGDRFGLRKVDNGFYLLINGEVVKNSFGVPVLFSERGASLLRLYVHDYDGVIPEGAFLVTGNLDHETVDSSRFGLVSRDDVKGVLCSHSLIVS